MRARISGRVQGVAYRAHAREQARRLRVDGWVRNLSDGSVELLAEGPRDRLDEMLVWCRRGPGFARVDDVQCIWEDARGDLDGFDIVP